MNLLQFKKISPKRTSVVKRKILLKNLAATRNFSQVLESDTSSDDNSSDEDSVASDTSSDESTAHPNAVNDKVQVTAVIAVLKPKAESQSSSSCKHLKRSPKSSLNKYV
jgi:hypothetical protein